MSNTIKQSTESGQETTGFDILGLDEVNACSHAESMIFIDPKSKEKTDFIMQVLGTHAETIQDDIYKQLNRARRDEFKAKKSGKVAEPNLIEEDIGNSISSIAKRIVGWSGLTDKGADIPYSVRMALQLCTQSPSLRAQVQEFSEELGNFGNSKS